MIIVAFGEISMLKKINLSKTSKRQNIAGITLVFLLLSFLCCTSHTFASGLSEPEAEDQCGQVAAMLNSQKNEISLELRLIKREIAVLKESISKPGITEIIGGIGYILGLFGIGYYIHARSLMAAKK